MGSQRPSLRERLRRRFRRGRSDYAETDGWAIAALGLLVFALIALAAMRLAGFGFWP